MFKKKKIVRTSGKWGVRSLKHNSSPYRDRETFGT